MFPIIQSLRYNRKIKSILSSLKYVRRIALDRGFTAVHDFHQLNPFIYGPISLQYIHIIHCSHCDRESNSKKNSTKIKMHCFYAELRIVTVEWTMFDISKKIAQKPKIDEVDIELNNNQMTIKFSGMLNSQ